MTNPKPELPSREQAVSAVADELYSEFGTTQAGRDMAADIIAALEAIGALKVRG